MDDLPPTLEYRTVAAKPSLRELFIAWLGLQQPDSRTAWTSLVSSILAWIATVGYWALGPPERGVAPGVVLALTSMNLALLAGFQQETRKVFVLAALAIDLFYFIMLFSAVLYYLSAETPGAYSI